MQPIVSFDRTLVTVLVDEVVHVMLELVAPPAAPMERPPLDVILVLDRSGSMAGEPLEAVKAATEQLLRLAGPGDRVGVVAFDDEVRMVLPLAHHDPPVVAPSIRALTDGGSTNLSGGWLKGMEMLAAAPRDGALRRVILLTDGHANVGITGNDQLASLVLGGHGKGVSTSCIGFADGYDEELLAAMADAGRGNDYWCAGPDHAARVFADEFGGLASVVAQNVSVEVRPTDAVAATAVLNDFPVTEVPGGLQVAMGDAYGGEHRRLVAKLHLRPLPTVGAVEVAELLVRWASTVGEVALHTVTVPVVVTAGSAGQSDTGGNPEVREEVLRLEVAKARREAREAAERGDYGTASQRLLHGAALAAPWAPDVALELSNDAHALDERQWTAADSKRHFSRSRSANRGRKSDYGDPQDGGR